MYTLSLHPSRQPHGTTAILRSPSPSVNTLQAHHTLHTYSSIHISCAQPSFSSGLLTARCVISKPNQTKKEPSPTLHSNPLPCLLLRHIQHDADGLAHPRPLLCGRQLALHRRDRLPADQGSCNVLEALHVLFLTVAERLLLLHSAAQHASSKVGWEWCRCWVRCDTAGTTDD